MIKAILLIHGPLVQPVAFANLIKRVFLSFAISCLYSRFVSLTRNEESLRQFHKIGLEYFHLHPVNCLPDHKGLSVTKHTVHSMNSQKKKKRKNRTDGIKGVYEQFKS